jgi:hypothetical protein
MNDLANTHARRWAGFAALLLVAVLPQLLRHLLPALASLSGPYRVALAVGYVVAVAPVVWKVTRWMRGS